MNEQTFSQVKTFARLAVFLVVFMVSSVMLALYLVIVELSDQFVQKTAIVSMMVGAIAGAVTTLIAGFTAALVAIANARKNVSVSEAKGPNNGGDE